jgi:hypothetical protein
MVVALLPRGSSKATILWPKRIAVVSARRLREYKEEEAMSRVSDVIEFAGDAALEREFTAEQALFGDVLYPSRAMAHSPGILRAAKNPYLSIDESGLLPPTLLALVYARVCGTTAAQRKSSS